MRKRRKRNAKRRRRRLKLRKQHKKRGGNPSKETKDKVLQRDGYCCQHCGTDRNLTLHHVIYRRHGGQATTDNLITLCEACHRYLHNTMG